MMTLSEIAYLCIPLATFAAGIVAGRYVFPKQYRSKINVGELVILKRKPLPDSIQAIIDEE